MTSLKSFVPAFGPSGYVASRPQLTDWRFRWLWRQHHAALIEAGAVIRLGNELHVAPDAADAFIVELGRRQALEGVRTSE